ncbi:MAG: riboflavin synthase [Bacteroidota bacterium]|nr:riboflavin synthase [Bacteroidota bacterium]
MFTGIIECIGEIIDVKSTNSNLEFEIASDISHYLSIDQSVSHQGICLTITQCNEKTHFVTAVAESISKTTMANWKTGDLLNLERALPANGRIDGHFVQGHVDQTAAVIDMKDKNGSYILSILLDSKINRNLLIYKGSICINGVSLTIAEINDQSFSTAIIPYTFEHTQFYQTRIGDLVNLEYDVLGKYIVNWMERRSKEQGS